MVGLGLWLGPGLGGSHVIDHMGTHPACEQIDWQTNTTENITFPQTTYQGGKSYFLGFKSYQELPIPSSTLKDNLP